MRCWEDPISGMLVFLERLMEDGAYLPFLVSMEGEKQ
jgi:hypothetical protein